MVMFSVTRKETTPIDGQKPGTSGLRKKVKVFMQPNYLHNFVQSTFNALSAEKVRGATLVVSGDGRYYSKNAIQIITKMAAANGVRRVWIGQNGLLSTPAVSAVIRERVGFDGSKATGSFILTASHNPGGPNEDFGIKYNMENGGPAPEGITDKIYENTKTIKEYLIAEDLPDVDISATGVTSCGGPEGQFDVEVFDSASDYVKLMKSIFDFESIHKLLSSPKFTFCYDALHGVAGAYANRIFVEELGAQESSLLNCTPKEDFGGGHPDPNLTYAKELVARMGLGKSNSQDEPPEFGAAADGDADRNMILGKRFFVTPSDSVAIIAANAVESIPYFSAGLKSMPTCTALDVVAKHLNLKFFEVPTGWKFFGNLMDAGLCSVCGEESFGTGSDHIRQKDGIWAVLAWSSNLAYRNKDNLDGGKLVTVEDIVQKHWATCGRHYYTRYDYENVDAGAAKELMANLVKMQSSLFEVNDIVKGIRSDVSKIVNAEEFEYEDPVDGSVSKHQGIRYLFDNGSQLVFGLSETGSEGATILLYIEQYEKDPSNTGITSPIEQRNTEDKKKKAHSSQGDGRRKEAKCGRRKEAKCGRRKGAKSSRRSKSARRQKRKGLVTFIGDSPHRAREHHKLNHLQYSYEGLMYTMVEVNGNKIRAMIDTGASNIFLAAREVQRLGLNVEGSSYAVSAANSSDIVVEGEATSSLKVGNWEGEVRFIIVQIKDFDLILGMDFLVKSDALVMPRKRSLLLMAKTPPEVVPCELVNGS